MELFDEGMGESFSVDVRRLTKNYVEFKTAAAETVMTAEVLVGSSLTAEMYRLLGRFNKEFEEAIVGEKKEASNALCMLWLVNHLRDISHSMTHTLQELSKDYDKATNLKAVLGVQLIAKKEILVYVCLLLIRAH